MLIESNPFRVLENNRDRKIIVSLYLGNMAEPDELTVIDWDCEWICVETKRGMRIYYQWSNIIAFSVDSITLTR